MKEQGPEIIHQTDDWPKDSLQGNDEALKYLSGSIREGTPVTLGPISEAPIQPSWHQNEGSSGGSQFYGGNEVVGSSGIKDLGWAGPRNTPRAVSAPAPAPAAESKILDQPYEDDVRRPFGVAGYHDLYQDTFDRYWTRKDEHSTFTRVSSSDIEKFAENPPQENIPTPAQNQETSIQNTQGGDIPQELQQMFINQGGSGMRWEPESRIWRSTREMDNEKQAIQKAEEWNKSTPDSKHGKAAESAGYKYVAEGKRVLLRKNSN